MLLVLELSSHKEERDQQEEQLEGKSGDRSNEMKTHLLDNNFNSSGSSELYGHWSVMVTGQELKSLAEYSLIFL